MFIDLSVLRIMKSKKIILASSSPRRQDILKQLGIPFKIIKSDFAEDLDKNIYKNPKDYTTETAKLKAYDVLEKVKNQNETVDIIISADTVVSFESKIIEKPDSKEHAVEILQMLSGKMNS